MPNSVWIRWTGSKLLQKMWIGSIGSPRQQWESSALWPPAAILDFEKNSFAGLFQGSSSMSMPNSVQIRWTGSKLLQKHWQYNASQIFDACGHLGNLYVSGIPNLFVHAKFCPNQMNGIQMPSKNVFSLHTSSTNPTRPLWQSSSMSSPVYNCFCKLSFVVYCLPERSRWELKRHIKWSNE